MKRHMVLFGLFLAAITIAPQAAWSQGNWAIARSPQNFQGACYAGIPPFPDPVSAIYTQMLATNLADLKSACQKAKDLSTDDPGNEAGCFTYSTDTITQCKVAGVPLPGTKKPASPHKTVVPSKK